MIEFGLDNHLSASCRSKAMSAGRWRQDFLCRWWILPSLHRPKSVDSFHSHARDESCPDHDFDGFTTRTVSPGCAPLPASKLA